MQRCTIAHMLIYDEYNFLSYETALPGKSYKVYWAAHILNYVSYVNCKGSIVLNDHVSGRTIGSTEVNVYLDCNNIKVGFLLF